MSPTESPLIVVAKVKDELRPATYPALHKDISSAQEEAARLATLNPDREFIVFQAVSAIKSSPLVITKNLAGDKTGIDINIIEHR